MSGYPEHLENGFSNILESYHAVDGDVSKISFLFSLGFKGSALKAT